MSNANLISSSLDVQSWISELPPVDAVRPPRCPQCHLPAAPVGERLRLHGHGLRQRDIVVVDRTGVAEVSVWVRRYLSTCCKIVVTVAPAGIRAGYRYALAAIAMALSFYAAGESHLAIRKRISVWSFDSETAWRSWSSLARWARSWRRLWPGLGVVDVSEPRQLARRIVFKLKGLGPPTGPISMMG